MRKDKYLIGLSLYQTYHKIHFQNIDLRHEAEIKNNYNHVEEDQLYMNHNQFPHLLIKIDHYLLCYLCYLLQMKYGPKPHLLDPLLKQKAMLEDR